MDKSARGGTARLGPEEWYVTWQRSRKQRVRAMNWILELRQVSRGIESFARAAETYFSTGAGVGRDSASSIRGSFEPAAARLVDRLRVLTSDSTLPQEARQIIGEFIERWDKNRGGGSGWPGLQFMLGNLSCLKVSLDVFLDDRPSLLAGLVRRSLLHLQRCIVADSSRREEWQRAFREGETTVERLGATHFLLHGLWAFKASAEGERTDLVLGGQLAITADLHAASEGLVLTEWKLVRSHEEVDRQASQGLRQAMLYGSGSLAGFELANERFIVMVSDRRIDVPQPQVEGETTYTYWNIAVDPAQPSASRG